MRKSELSKIPYENIDENKNLNLLKTEADISYFITAKIVKTNPKERTLCLSFFHKEDFKLRYRVFITKNDYITQCLDSNASYKWKTGTLENISYNWIKHSMILNEKSRKYIMEFFKVENQPLKAINEYQKNILAKRLQEKHAIEINAVEKNMKVVPKLPKNFKKWVEETALYNSRYIFYKYKRTNKAIVGYCTHCKQEVLIDKPKHNTEGICPNCKSKITYKSIGKSKYIEDKRACVIIQKVPNSLLIRYFIATKTYGTNYKDPKLYIEEPLRDFYNGKNFENYEYRYYAQTNILCWCKGIRSGLFGRRYEYDDIALYTRNLNNVLSNTPYKYSQIKEYTLQKPGFGFNIYTYLVAYGRYPFIEYLIKLKLFNLVTDILARYYYYGGHDIEKTFNLKGKNFSEIFRLHKSYIPRLKHLNVTFEEFEMIQNSYLLNKPISDEQLSYVISKNISSCDLFYISSFTTIHKIIKYIEKQKQNINNAEKYIISDWKDYIKNCVFLRYDLKNDFNLFPKDLGKSHDDVLKLIKQKHLEICNKNIKARYLEESNFYYWEYKDYFITMAKSADALIAEGQSLHHCVGTNYREPMACNETTILFLRKKSDPQKSFFTIEYKDNNIEQIRGFKNCSPSSEVKNIAELYVKHMKVKNIELREAI